MGSKSKRASSEKIPRRSSLNLRKSRKRTMVIASLILLGIIIGGGGYLFFTGSKMFKGSILGFFGRGLLQTDEYNRTNVLFFGTTEDSKEHAKIGANQARTDSIMLASIDQQDKAVMLTSVPRDFWVTYGQSCLNGTEGKINAAYLCGSNNGKDEEKGAKMLMDAVQDIYGLDMHYYVHVNFSAVETIINALGGIEVEIDSNDPRGIYDPAIGVKYPNGIVKLDGENALRLSRARDSTGAGYGLAGGNFSREEYQQKIMIALRDKAMSSGMLKNPLTLFRLFSSLGSNVRTNFSANEMRTLVDLAREVDDERVETVYLHELERPLIVTDRVAGQSIIRPTLGLYNYDDIHAFIEQKVSGEHVSR